jgi:hypothetical protein
LFDLRGRQQAQDAKRRAKGKPTWSELGTGQKAAGIGCLSVVGLVFVIVVLAVVLGGGESERDEAVLAEIDRIQGTAPGCLADANDGDWQDAAVVLDSESSDELVIVEVFLSRTLTGEDLRYRFGVPIGPDGMPTGGVIPGNELSSRC